MKSFFSNSLFWLSSLNYPDVSFHWLSTTNNNSIDQWIYRRTTNFIQINASTMEFDSFFSDLFSLFSVDQRYLIVLSSEKKIFLLSTRFTINKDKSNDPFVLLSSLSSKTWELSKMDARIIFRFPFQFSFRYWSSNEIFFSPNKIYHLDFNLPLKYRRIDSTQKEKLSFSFCSFVSISH